MSLYNYFTQASNDMLSHQLDHMITHEFSCSLINVTTNHLMHV